MGMDAVIESIARDVIDVSLKLHKKLGPGLLERVYLVILARNLELRGYQVERERAVAIRFEEMNFDEGFQADLIVNNCLLIELKSIEKLAPVHGKQGLTYLRLLDFRLGLLINFGGVLLKI
jgi:GxxExxY protein